MWKKYKSNHLFYEHQIGKIIYISDELFIQNKNVIQRLCEQV